MNNKIYNVLFIFMHLIFLSLLSYSGLFETFYSFSVNVYEKYAIISFSIPVIMLLYTVLYWSVKRIIDKEKSNILPIILIIVDCIVVWVLLSKICNVIIPSMIIYFIFFGIIYMIVELFKKNEDIYTKKDIILLCISLVFIIFTFVIARINSETMFKDITSFIEELPFKSIPYFYYSFYIVPVYIFVIIYTGVILLNAKKIKTTKNEMHP